MKRIFFIAAFVAAVFVQPAFAQNNNKPSSLATLLQSYYDIKNALINSDETAAAAKAADFLKLVNSEDMKTLPDADMKSFMPLQDKLAFDAKHISESKDIAHQREHFSGFSANFFKLAKGIKLTDQAIYYDYCPMKKSYWLSNEASVKNPYFGKQMLNCGKVTETLK